MKYYGTSLESARAAYEKAQASQRGFSISTTSRNLRDLVWCVCGCPKDKCVACNAAS